MESSDKCDKCVGYSICANHIKKGDFACAPFLRAVEEKLKSPNTTKVPICPAYIRGENCVVQYREVECGYTPCKLSRYKRETICGMLVSILTLSGV